MLAKKGLLTAGRGTLAGWNGYCSLENLLDYTTSRVLIIQTGLAREPELTETIYQNIREAAEKVGQGNYILGFASALAAGACGAMAIYNACKEEKEHPYL